VTLDTGEIISGDLYLDCTGFKRLTAKKFDHKLKSFSNKIAHDRAVIVANGYTKNIEKELQPYTSGFGMDYGWTFSVPLVDRKSYGYVFDSRFVSADDAFEELASLSDPATRVIDRIDLQWTPGCFAQSWKNNYVMLGLASGFVDAFDANTIGINFLQVFSLINLLKNHSDNLNQHRDKYNLSVIKYFSLVADRIELHFGLAPRSTSAYWQHNHEIAVEKKLHEKALDVFSHPNHSIAAHYRNMGQPYMWHLYLSNTLYYDIDMSGRCRQSSGEILDFAEEYFRSFNKLNHMRSQLAPTMKQWYKQNNIDIDQFIKF
jgi:tryptophan halogenase